MNSTFNSRANLVTALVEIDKRLDTVLDSVGRVNDSDSAELFHPLDGALCGIYHGLKDSQRYAILHGQAQQSSFDPAQTLGKYSASRPYALDTQRVSVDGDKRIVATILQLLQENVELAVGGRLSMRLFIEEPIRYTYNFAEESALGDTLSVGKTLTIPISTIHDAWEAATDGGSMELSPTRITLYLQGDVPRIQEGDQLMEAASRALAPGVLRLKSWRSTSGAYEGPFAATAEAKRLYAQAATIAKDSVTDARNALE